MNKDHLQQIVDHYIDRFEELNGPGNEEYYKWQIIQRFKPMMDEALAADNDAFASKLYEVKKLTRNVIDSYTQPLNGLVEFAKREPDTVRGMFTRLFSVAQSDVQEKQTAVSEFLTQSHRLRDQYFPDSYLYNDDLHSVTGYLFLYDPNRNYLYKATHCRDFADCIEFYDDWGSGENTRLDIFYRMCDQAVAAIKENQPLIATAASRYEIDPHGMHPDEEKHILLFDLIYCCSTYGLFDGISFVVPKNSERKLMQERKEKAKTLAAELDDARVQLTALNEAKAYLAKHLTAGSSIRHKAFGEGVIEEASEKTITVGFSNVGKKQLGTITCVANGLITVDDAAIAEKLQVYRAVLSRDEQIRSAYSWAEKAFAPYADYLG